MFWYEELLNYIDYDKEYKRKELVDDLENIRPDLSKSAYDWSIRQLLDENKLERLGYDLYSLPSTSFKDDYFPSYSKKTLKIIKKISKKYPLVNFVAFETTLMNEFLNHLIAQNTIFIEVDKESSIYIFRFLQECNFKNVMYKPNLKDFDLYWSKDCVVVTDLISESPLNLKKSHFITLEKMMVDLLSDKIIGNTFNKAEFSSILKQAQENYLLDSTKILRYASRRNKKDELLHYLKEK